MHNSLHTLLLRNNVAHTHNTSAFKLNESLSRMRVSLDYRLIEVNIDVTSESYVTGYNCKNRATVPEYGIFL